MAGETVITVIGNLTADPEIKFLPNGDAVANFSIASTPRTYNRESGQWEDGDALFMRCAAWRQLAENVSESCSRGTRVIAQGRLKQRSYETREGEKRTVIELEVDEIGPSVRFATTTVHRAERGQGGGGGQRRQQGGGGQAWGGQGQRQQGGQRQEGYQDGSGWGRTGGGQRGGGGSSWGGGGGQQGGGGDPWASAPASGGTGGYDDEPPF